MKIIVVHGDHSHTSYERLRVLVDAASKRGWEIDRIFNKNKNIGETLTFSGLFKKDRFVLIENFNLLNKKDLNLINRRLEVDGITVVIYHPGTISKTALKQIKIIHKVEEYKLPKLIWAYLDSFFPGNLKTSLSTLHKLINNEPVEFVFALLTRHLRDVYWAKVDPVDPGTQQCQYFVTGGNFFKSQRCLKSNENVVRSTFYSRRASCQKTC